MGGFWLVLAPSVAFCKVSSVPHRKKSASRPVSIQFSPTSRDEDERRQIREKHGEKRKRWWNPILSMGRLYVYLPTNQNHKKTQPFMESVNIIGETQGKRRKSDDEIHFQNHWTRLSESFDWCTHSNKKGDRADVPIRYSYNNCLRYSTGMSMVLRINRLFHPYISRLDTSLKLVKQPNLLRIVTKFQQDILVVYVFVNLCFWWCKYF